MGTYHVLSNDDLFTIIQSTMFAAVILSVIFGGLASRNASPTYKKCKAGKIVPWVLLLLLIGDAVWTISQWVVYPWGMEPHPSDASAFRELIYNGSGFPIFGWANDEQLVILNDLAICVLLLCWTVYAFQFQRSDTKWWKKVCKVLAYIILSILIAGFSFHELRDVLVIAVMFVLPVVVLLLVARVKPAKKAPVEAAKADGGQSITDAEAKAASPSTVADESSDSRGSLETKHCPHCGKEIEGDSGFCKYCGKKLK